MVNCWVLYIIFATAKQCTSAFINCRSFFEYFLAFDAIGLQSLFRCPNSSGGFVIMVVSAMKLSSGLLAP